MTDEYYIVRDTDKSGIETRLSPNFPDEGEALTNLAILQAGDPKSLYLLRSENLQEKSEARALIEEALRTRPGTCTIIVGKVRSVRTTAITSIIKTSTGQPLSWIYEDPATDEDLAEVEEMFTSAGFKKMHNDMGLSAYWKRLSPNLIASIYSVYQDGYGWDVPTRMSQPAQVDLFHGPFSGDAPDCDVMDGDCPVDNCANWREHKVKSAQAALYLIEDIERIISSSSKPITP